MKKKNLSTGLTLSFLFDAFGVLYTSVSGFLFFLVWGIIFFILLRLFINPAEFIVSTDAHSTIVSSSNGIIKAKSNTIPQLKISAIHLITYFTTILIFKSILLYWTYNVIKEQNRRIDLNLPKLSGWEEIDVGFKNLFYLFLTFLVSGLFSLGIFALANFIPGFSKTTDLFQTIFLLLTFGVFLLILCFYWFKNKHLNNPGI